MPDFIPTAQEQLKFLKNIQLILQSGSFSSTYKFALLISLSRLAIEKGEDVDLYVAKKVAEFASLQELLKLRNQFKSEEDYNKFVSAIFKYPACDALLFAAPFTVTM